MENKKRSEFIDSGIINSVVEYADHIILGLNYDVTSSGLKGADKGPAAIAGVLREQLEPYNPQLGFAPCERTKIAYYLPSGLNGLCPQLMVRYTVNDCEEFLRIGKELTILGGEHSVAIPALKAYSQIYNPELVTILHIDAHLDLRDTDEFRVKPYGKYAHCCVMRRAWDFGFRNFVQVGARSYSKEERDFAEANNFSVFWDDTFCALGVKKAIKTERVWISLDVDGINPAEMPATGTPVGGGPGFNDIRKLLACVAREKFIVGADVVEVAPDLGPTDLTAYNAAQLVYDLIGYRVLRK